KLGVHIDEVNTGKYAALGGDPDRPLTAEETAIIQREVNKIYQVFMERVANGRNLTVAQVDSIGQGRAWTGDQAVALCLVNRIGKLHTAVHAAASKAELNDYEHVAYPKQKSPFEDLFATSKQKVKPWMLKDEAGAYPNYLMDIKQVLHN